MVVLGLGSNVGEREAYLAEAVRRLGVLLGAMRVSRVLESRALPAKEPQPGDDRPFLNMAVAGDTALEPQALLASIKAIEAEMGRVYRCVWGPREIDIDILAMDGVILEADKLRIPHPELLNRDFALVPLNDVAPGWLYPVGEYKGLVPAQIISAKGYGLNADLRETGLVFDV